jgi:oligoendopeptidase F
MSEAGTAPHWDLSLLYTYGSPKLKGDMERIRSFKETFPLWKERIYRPDFTRAEFSSLLYDLSQIEELASRISGFSSLWFSEDTASQEAQSLVGTVDSELVELENALLFFRHWWKDLDDKRAEAFMEAAPELRYHLGRIRALKPHTLTEPEEKIINLKDVTGSQALVVLYDAITNRYRFKADFLKGREGDLLTREELMVHVRSPLPADREGAYREYCRVFSEEGPTLGLVFQSLARGFRMENVGLRGYKSPRGVRDKINDLPAEVVDSLLRVSSEEAPKAFGRYFRMKAKALGMERLRRCDIYAPLGEAREEDVPFRDALEEVRLAFSGFSPEMAGYAMKVAEDRHLSAAPLPGKESGAYCASLSPEDSPWVFMTYKGRRQDMFTLAHELGHAVHSQLAAGEGIFQYHAALPLAETASTFGEMLLAKRLQSEAGDKALRQGLVFHLLDDAYATVGRQAFFSLFEAEAHDMASKGATSRELSDRYLENLHLQFGDSVDVGPEFAWEWSSIPHFFHTPFYVYAYTFGQLLVYSLYRLYELEGPSFAPRLLKILSKGGGAAPADILASAGVGPLDDDFWRGGFKVIEGFMEGIE